MGIGCTMPRRKDRGGSLPSCLYLVGAGQHTDKLGEHSSSEPHGYETTEADERDRLLKLQIEAAKFISDPISVVLWAACEGKLELLVRGLQGVKSTEVTDKGGNTPLILAARNGHLELVRYMVEHTEADVEAEDENGWTPLIKAASKGRFKVVQYLVESANVNVDAMNKHGDTALILAAFFGHFEVVTYLVEEAKADVHHRCNKGKTALDWVRDGQQDECKSASYRISAFLSSVDSRVEQKDDGELLSGI